MARKRKGDGQTALVTGASYGIGLDLAECFAKDGYNLILTARSADALKQAADKLSTQYKITATPIALDLGAHGGGTKLAQEIAAKNLNVDVLVNNAGYGIAGAMDGSKADEQLGMVDLNVRALLELTQIYWPSMLKNKRGGVLNVASTAAFQPGPLMATYYASKAFVLSISEALWKEAEGTGVHVSCLCPGPTVSKFRERAGTGKTRLSNAGEAMPSMAVAKQGYRGFQKNTRVVITGLRNRILAGATAYLPRTTLLGIVKNLQSPK
ncbi:MAG: SDR family NAD(P)-dependent oxidoreductase [Rhizomicrobium sp.]